MYPVKANRYPSKADICQGDIYMYRVKINRYSSKADICQGDIYMYPVKADRRPVKADIDTSQADRCLIEVDISFFIVPQILENLPIL
jgi:hypothetical protein